MQMLMSTVILSVPLLILIILAVLILNGTAIFHREAGNYQDLPVRPVMDSRAEPIVRQRGPEESRGCFLFIHGFPSSPALYRRAAEQAEAAGYDVLAPLLPGFGRDPEVFTQTNFTMWYAALRDLYLRERPRYGYFHVVGSSMGGALTLTLAAEFSGTEYAPTSVTTAAAPVFLNSLLRDREVQSPALYLVRFISWFIRYRPAAPARPGEEPPDRDGDSGWVGYHGLFPRQIYSLNLAIKRVRRRLSQVTVPLMAIHSRGDRTVPFKNIWALARGVGSSRITVRILDLRRWEHPRHSLFLYRSVREGLFEEVLAFARREEDAAAGGIVPGSEGGGPSGQL